MSLSNIKKSELKQTGFSGGTYKGFDVFVHLTRQGYKFKIGLLLESNSDACHWISSYHSATTLTELVNEAKALINEYEFTAKQLLDLHSFIDIDTSIHNVDVCQIVNNWIESEKKKQIRTLSKCAYKALMSSYRHARNIIITLISIEPDSHREYAKRLKRLNEAFDSDYLIPQGFDQYDPIYVNAWVINALMDKRGKTAAYASDMAFKLQSLQTGESYREKEIAAQKKSKHKNRFFYLSILKRKGAK